MVKKVSAAEIDNGLEKTREATLISVCAGEPVDFADATTLIPTGKMIASLAMTPTDLVLADGDTTDGRKVRIIAPSALTIAAPGTNVADHVALTKSVGPELLAVTTCNPLSLDFGGGSNTVTIPEYKREGRQPI